MSVQFYQYLLIVFHGLETVGHTRELFVVVPAFNE